MVPLAGAEEDEMMEDVSKMAGGGLVSGQDALANLETTLRPVEKYAVRFVEEVSFCCSFPTPETALSVSVSYLKKSWNADAAACIPASCL